MRQHTFLALLFASVTFNGCATVALDEVSMDELDVDVTLVQEKSQTRLDVWLRRGIWQQGVTASSASLFAGTESGRLLTLQPANHTGQYGFIEPAPAFLTDLNLGPLPVVYFPAMADVDIPGKDRLEGRLFNREDELSLPLAASSGQQRFLVATAQCGNSRYSSRQKISADANTLTISMSGLINRLNAAAEADLNGLLTIELAVEEEYVSNWPRPFDDVVLTARDQLTLQLDTSGFRFKADVAVQLSSQLSIRLQNQPWPTRYCY